MTSNRVHVLASGVLALTAATSALAQEAHEETDVEIAHEFHRNFAAVFLGGSREDGRRERTVGLEYERRFSASFGVGGVVERTAGDTYTWVYVLPLAYHAGPWKMYVGPGFEDGEHGRDRLWRIGAERAFEVNGWEIAPQLDFDFVENDEILVIGITFGRSF
jgi:hypothetical protein